MRIAYICADPGVPVFGTKGCSIHVQEIVRAMLQRGDEVELFVARQGGDPPRDLQHCIVHELGIRNCNDTRSREVEQILWNQRVTATLDRQLGFDLLYERYSLWSANAISWAKRNRIPSILEVNAPLIDEQAQHRELVQYYLARVLAKQAMQGATGVIAVSEAIVPYCRQFRSCEGPVQVIPNGVNTQRFSPGIVPLDPYIGFTVGFVGSLKPWHGLDVLIEAFARFSELMKRSSGALKAADGARLLIVGDGPQRAMLEDQLKNRIDIQSKVKFVGAVPADAVPGWINSMDVAVAPYPDLSDFYFSPLKIYEYMASGRAVVASSTGQIRNVIQHRSNGLLYDPRDPDQLVASLMALRNSHPLCRALGEAARDTAIQHRWQRVLQHSLAIVSNAPSETTSVKGMHDELSV